MKSPITVSIEDEGVIGGRKQFKFVVTDLKSRGIKEAIVDRGSEVVTHWWLLRRIKEKTLIAYFGTPETFAASQE